MKCPMCKGEGKLLLFYQRMGMGPAPGIMLIECYQCKGTGKTQLRAIRGKETVGRGEL